MPGFLTAWGYWIAAWVGNAAIAIAFVGYLGVFTEQVNTNNAVALAVVIGVIWLLTAINVLGTRGSSWMRVATAILIRAAGLVGLVGLFWIDGGSLTPFAPEGGGDWHIGAAATLALWAFIGLESATVPAAGVKDPEAHDPARDDHGTAITTVVYMVAIFAVAGLVARETLAESSSPFADAAERDLGRNAARRGLRQVGRSGGDDRSVRLSQRLDPAGGACSARCGGGQPLPEAVRSGERNATDTRVRTRGVVAARDQAAAPELLGARNAG